MTWVFLLYGLIRWFKPKSIPYFESIRGWDRVIHTGIIWVLQLAAAAVQVGFVGKHLHCQEECAELNGGSRNRNIAYAVLAWLLWSVHSFLISLIQILILSGSRGALS